MTTERDALENSIGQMRQAYGDLVAGAERLLSINRLFWTEKLLLKLVRNLYRRRLAQIGEIVPDGEN